MAVSRIVGSQGKGTFNFTRNCQACLPSGHDILHPPHQQCVRVLVAPGACQHLVMSTLNFSHSGGYVLDLFVVLFCISTTTYYLDDSIGHPPGVPGLAPVHYSSQRDPVLKSRPSYAQNPHSSQLAENKS